MIVNTIIDKDLCDKNKKQSHFIKMVRKFDCFSVSYEK